MHPEQARFVPRTFPPLPPARDSRSVREREAKLYWDSLSPEQEAWVLRKMNFARFGQRIS
ncbi:MAG TPA: hypothetical protein DEV93_07595 [Chloroflexi bacterium]|nr:hypothetical protein [Chloroflexota bacterium]